MHCLENIQKNRIPNDIIMLYLTLYRFVGRNREMLKTVESDFEILLNDTIRTDTYFLSKIFELKISEARIKSLLTKDVQPKTKDERLLKNIKEAFKKIHKETDDFELLTREIQDLLYFLYQNVAPKEKLHFAKAPKQKKDKINLLSSGQKTKRESLEALVKTFKQTLKENNYEPTFVVLNFIVDFFLLKPFNAYNEEIGIILLYILLLDEEIEAFHLSSFYEKLYKRYAKYQKLRQEASHNWAEGLSDTHGLHRFFLEIFIESYQDVSEILRNYAYDQQINKSDYIENTINKLEEVFTKEQIRQHHPTISDSTINRTLKRLRDEKKIRPLGKGRSASWMKLYQSPKKKTIEEQINWNL